MLPASEATTATDESPAPGARKKPAAAPSSTPSSASSGSGTVPGGGPTVPAVGDRPWTDLTPDLGMYTGALTPAAEIMPTADQNLFDSLFGPQAGKKPLPLMPENKLNEALFGSEKKNPWENVNTGTGVAAMGGAPVLQPSQPHQPEYEKERQAREAALPSAKRLKNAKIDPLTWDEYQALDPKQRAAVDFNTSLTQAVARDKRNQEDYAPNETQREVYNASVTDMFGTDGGSKLYAPETLAVLNQLNWSDQAGDLDDFLKLKVAFKAGDLKDLARAEQADDLWGVPGTKPVDTLTKVQEGLATSQQAMAQALVTGENLLQSVGTMSRAERQQDVGYMGGLRKDLPYGLGYGSTGDDLEFQKAFDLLATKSNAKNPDQMREILDKMHATVNSPDVWDKFMYYLQSRSLNTEQYGLGLAPGGVDSGDYHSPQAFRVLLGLEKGKAHD